MLSPSKRGLKKGLPRSHSVSALECLHHKQDKFKKTKSSTFQGNYKTRVCNNKSAGDIVRTSIPTLVIESFWFFLTGLAKGWPILLIIWRKLAFSPLTFWPHFPSRYLLWVLACWFFFFLFFKVFVIGFVWGQGVDNKVSHCGSLWGHLSWSLLNLSG